MKFTQEDLWETIEVLGWQPNDDIHIEIGGTSVYAIDWHKVGTSQRHPQV